MPRLVQLLALPLLLSPIMAEESSVDQAALLRDARIACAKVRMIGPKDYEICVDDVMMTQDLGMVRLWDPRVEFTLTDDEKLLCQARIACASVQQEDRKVVSPSPELTGSAFENCVEEVVHTKDESAAAAWMEVDEQRKLRGGTSSSAQSA